MLSPGESRERQRQAVGGAAGGGGGGGDSSERQDEAGQDSSCASKQSNNNNNAASIEHAEGDDEDEDSCGEQVITSLQVNSKKALPVANLRNSNGRAREFGASFQDKRASSRGKRKTSGEVAQFQALAARPNQPAAATSAKVKRSFVLDPAGQLHYHWSMLVSLAFLYNFWAISYRFSFQEINFHSVAFWFALDYAADLIYVLDVVVNLRTGYLEEGVLQRNISKISQHYRECTRFYLDCFCLLPLDTLYLSFGFNSILRFPRLVKIYKFWSYTDRTERHTNYPNVYRTFTLVHYILVIFHWNACLFHMISKNKIIDIEDLYKIDGNQCGDILCQYLHAFYWSTLALTTVGDLPRPRSRGEYLYVTTELFFGLFLFASVLGHVANIVTNVSAARKEFQAKLDAVKTFMRMRRVSEELQSKVIRWFDYLWSSQQNSDEERSVACLPDRLKAELAIHVHLDTLKRVDIFQNTEAGFLCELVLRLKPVLFSPGDYVCRKHEVGHEMYIVSKGILEVVTNEGKTVVATLKAGSYFGEISVLNVGSAGNKRTASVRSVGYSDLFCLNKQDLWDVLKNYPNAEARIRARAEERLTKLGHNSSAPGQGESGGSRADARKSRSAYALQQQCLRSPRAPTELVVGGEANSCLHRSFIGTPSEAHRRRVCSSASCHQAVLAAARQSSYEASQHRACPVAPQPDCCHWLLQAAQHQRGHQHADCLRAALPASASMVHTVQDLCALGLLGGHGLGSPCCSSAQQCQLQHQHQIRSSSFRNQNEQPLERARSKFSCSHSLQLPEAGLERDLRRSSGGNQRAKQAMTPIVRTDNLAPLSSANIEEQRVGLSMEVGLGQQQPSSSTTTSSLPSNISGRSSRQGQQAATGETVLKGSESADEFRIQMD